MDLLETRTIFLATWSQMSVQCKFTGHNGTNSAYT